MIFFKIAKNIHEEKFGTYKPVYLTCFNLDYVSDYLFKLIIHIKVHLKWINKVKHWIIVYIFDCIKLKVLFLW